MARSPFQPSFETLPAELAIFPLSGVLLLPGGRLPLNIFEPRYLAMILDCLGEGRLIGMIQPVEPEQNSQHPKIFDVGCVGQVVAFQESNDGRLLITLDGVCRFRVAEEIAGRNGYRRVRADYAAYEADTDQNAPATELDRSRLLTALKPFFTINNLQVNWKALEAAPDAALITSLASICPFEPREKQALLEAPDITTRAEILTALLEMAVLESRASSSGGFSQ
jgi:Lon protease-like protein